jgi:hypothetical protein
MTSLCIFAHILLSNDWFTVLICWLWPLQMAQASTYTENVTQYVGGYVGGSVTMHATCFTRAYFYHLSSYKKTSQYKHVCHADVCHLQTLIRNLILEQTDLVSANTLNSIQAIVKRLNPSAKVITSVCCKVPLTQVNNTL